MRQEVKNNIIYLIFFTLITCVAVLYTTTGALDAYSGTSDILVYHMWYENATVNHMVPYTGYHVDYPILFWVPITIAGLVESVVGSYDAFIATFQAFMVLCTIGSVICVYFIASSMYGDKRGFAAGFLMSTGIATAYFTAFRFDVFPVFLMMLSLLLIIYQKNRWFSFASGIAGFFTKLFPMVAMPFIFLYDSKGKSLKYTLLSALGILSMLIIAISITLIIFPGSLYVVSDSVGDRGDIIYANTIIYAIGSIVQLASGFSLFEFPKMVSMVTSAIVAGVISIVLFVFWRSERDEEQLLVSVLASLFILMIANTHYSPQFAIWMFPILAILLSRGFYDYLAFIILQIIVYLEFPIFYNHLYTNNGYIIPVVILFFILKWFVFTDVVLYLVDEKLR